MTQPLLQVDGLTKHFPITTGWRQTTVGHVKAVDDVSFSIASGQTLGLVGESGCGKTTTGRLVLRLIERTAGQIHMNIGDGPIDLGGLRGEKLRRFRRHVQMIFQDPYSSLNPRLTVYDIIAEPLKALGDLPAGEIEDRVRELTKHVGLRPEFLQRFPHAFSGGQRQRVCIARSLALDPKLIVCDEPVSALDVSVQAQIINLMKDLQQEAGLTYLFIAHDLSVVENIATRVAVMYAGRIVEIAPTDELFARPRHPYTHALMNAVPRPDPKLRKDRELLPGDVADPSDLPSGCAFHPRCRFAQDTCREQTPVLRDIGGQHQAACHLAEDVNFGNG
ncbi:MAG: ATP-binding cassette domain-containing protein [Gemmatimonadetes bacterium]|jgi:peptide/nickel transport system ATP-binding protein|nr:ATP-binding cassette domain-containing protein [Gemmatimonadota bacterium]MBT7858972.1 ATP-binding cassette domain-containing protein [Gemmatimonadota bacterium]